MEDNSQSSDLFSDKDRPFSMDIDDKLEATLLHLRSALCGDVKFQSSRDTFSLFFSNTLFDCASCIDQKLELVSIILEDPENIIGKLTEVLEDVIGILQMLSSFLKNVREAVTMSCASLKTFPVTTGQVLLKIFTHCKESETLYGEQLQYVEEQLKSLFKACHELQVIYLNILEKYFVFDLANTQELDVLLNALEINLQIGELVQALDLKTMAEQWKAYTMICERYSHYLIDKRMFQDSSACLCNMITNNVEIAYEQDGLKAVMRSLKVSNFAIKILAKLCHIFKHAVEKRLDHIVKLLVDIHMKHPSIIGNDQKSPQFIQAFTTNILAALDSVVIELLSDDIFIQFFIHYGERAKQTDSIVGYLLAIVTTMKCLIQSTDHATLDKWMSDSGSNLFQCLFLAIRRGHTSLNLDYKFNLSSNSYYCGLYEYLLLYTSLLALHCDIDQYEILEGEMLGALLGTDVYSAMFASDLWLSLARISPSNLTIDQLTYLCNTYKQLYHIPTFTTSPQHTNLSHIITRLFKNLPKAYDKNRIYNQFELTCDTNRGLWVVMKIKNLPDVSQRKAEGMVVDGLKIKMKKVLNSDIVMECDLQDLILQLKLAATCSFVVSENIVAELVNAWLKVCPVTNRSLQSNALSTSNLWLLQYVEAVQDLTMVLLRYFQRNSLCLIKVFHVISKITTTCCIEIKLILISLIFKLSLCDIESNTHTVEQLLKDVYRNLFKENNYIFKTKLFELALQQMRNKKIEDLITKITNEDPDLEKEWNSIQDCKNRKNIKDQLKVTDSIEYTHKCLPSIEALKLDTCKSESLKFDSQNSNNFDLTDIDGLFSQESENEPAIKKAKPNSFEVDNLLNLLDNNIEKLTKLNVPVNMYRDRIIVLSEKLRNIFEPSI